MGEFDECIGVSSPPDDGIIVYGKYCTLSFRIPLPPEESYTDDYEEILVRHELYKFVEPRMIEMNLENYPKINPMLKMIEGANIIGGKGGRLGICIPHTCRAYDIELAINKSIYNKVLEIKILKFNASLNKYAIIIIRLNFRHIF